VCCHDWIARQAPLKLRRSPVPQLSCQLDAWKLFTPLHSSFQPSNRHDEACYRPPRGSRSRLPSLGSKVTHTAGSHCRRSVSDRTCPPPVVYTFRAPRGVLLRGDESHKGMIALGLQFYVDITLDRHDADPTFSTRSNMKSKHKRHCQQRAQKGVRAPATISKSWQTRLLQLFSALRMPLFYRGALPQSPVSPSVRVPPISLWSASWRMSLPIALSYLYIPSHRHSLTPIPYVPLETMLPLLPIPSPPNSESCPSRTLV
jgi:hypothetical protein